MYSEHMAPKHIGTNVYATINISQTSSGMCRRRYVSVIGWLSVVGVEDTRLV